MTPGRGLQRLAGFAAILGGLVWIPVRLAIGGTWGTTVAGLGYVQWNQLMVVPLALLVGGIVVLWSRAGTSRARTAALVAAVGLAGMLAGVVVEFWIFGGLEGDRDGAIVGWLIYLLAGVLVHVVGLVAYGIARGRALGALALAIAALHLLWIPAGLSGIDVLLALDQALIGLSWVAVGVIGLIGAGSPVDLDWDRDRRAVQ
jgi:hypothetical protein